jgi:excisionase family DNA binding protein
MISITDNLPETNIVQADAPKVYDLREVARLAVISVRTAGRLAERNLIPGRVAGLGRLIRFSREAVDAWLSGQ